MPTPKRQRDLEKHYSVAEFAAKLRRLADTVETGKRFHIQICRGAHLIPDQVEAILIPPHLSWTLPL